MTDTHQDPLSDLEREIETLRLKAAELDAQLRKIRAEIAAHGLDTTEGDSAPRSADE